MRVQDEASGNAIISRAEKRRLTSNQARNTEPRVKLNRVAAFKTFPLLIQTNHLNLASILSCGYLKPIGGFRKYYTDLLDLAPGWILLTSEPQVFGVDHVTSEPPSLPIYIELANKLETPNTLLASPDGTVFATDVPISISNISTIHFRSDFELNEILARKYSGIDYSLFNLKVSPQLFSDGPTRASIEKFIKSLPNSTKRPAFKLIDKRAGAIAALLVTGNTFAIDPIDLRALLGLSENQTSDGAALMDFSTFTAHDPMNADSVLLAASLAELSMVDRFSNWDPSIILRAISARFATVAPDPEPTLDLLRNVYKVINLKRSFGNVGPGPGTTAANALQWILTNPEINVLLEPPHFITSSSQSHFFAALMSGYLTGFELSSADLKTSDVCRFLWDWQASALECPQKLERKVVVQSDKTTWTIINKGKIVASGRSADSSLKNEEKVEDREYSVSLLENNGWFECITYFIDAPADQVSISINNGRIAIKVPGPIVLEKKVDVERLALRVGKVTPIAEAAAQEKKAKPKVSRSKSKAAK